MNRRRGLVALAFAALAVGLLVNPAPVRADSVTIFNDVTNPMTLTLVTSSTSVLAAHTQGLALGVVASTFGAVALGDFGGSFPNAILLSINFPGLTESLVIVLNYAGMTINGATTMVPAFAAPFSPTITDPSLLAMLSGALVFDFQLIGVAVDPSNANQTISQWTLTDIQIVQPVPEPGTILLTTTGLIGLLAKRKLIERRARS